MLTPMLIIRPTAFDTRELKCRVEHKHVAELRGAGSGSELTTRAEFTQGEHSADSASHS